MCKNEEEQQNNLYSLVEVGVSVEQWVKDLRGVRKYIFLKYFTRVHFINKQKLL